MGAPCYRGPLLSSHHCSSRWTQGDEPCALILWRKLQGRCHMACQKREASAGAFIAPCFHCLGVQRLMCIACHEKPLVGDGAFQQRGRTLMGVRPKKCVPKQSVSVLTANNNSRLKYPSPSVHFSFEKVYLTVLALQEISLIGTRSQFPLSRWRGRRVTLTMLMER